MSRPKGLKLDFGARVPRRDPLHYAHSQIADWSRPVRLSNRWRDLRAEDAVRVVATTGWALDDRRLSVVDSTVWRFKAVNQPSRRPGGKGRFLVDFNQVDPR